MSMSPTGDKGQRYEVSCFGYPFEGQECVIGWVDTLDAAKRMMTGISFAPGASSVSVRDRWKKTPEWPGDKYTQYCGVLR